MSITSKYPDAILERACPYKNSYISFIDILGFKGLVQDERNNYKIAGPFMALQDLFNMHNGNGSAQKLSLALISDTIVFSADAEIPNIIENVISITVCTIREYWEEGILLRGAITHGKLFHEGNIVFGPALVDAYMLERESAIYPRIVVSEDMFKNHIEGAGFQEYFVSDPHGLRYFDYFGASMGKLLPSGYCLDLEKGKKWLEENLIQTADNAGIHAKYEWLKNEWNNALVNNRTHIVPPIEQYMIL